MCQEYSSKQYLHFSEFPNKSLGVEATQIGDDLFQVEYERLSIWTATFGSNVSRADLRKHVKKSTQIIITSLDAVIEELQAHRRRLQTEIESIEKNGIVLIQLANEAGEEI